MTMPPSNPPAEAEKCGNGKHLYLIPGSMGSSDLYVLIPDDELEDVMKSYPRTKKACACETSPSCPTCGKEKCSTVEMCLIATNDDCDQCHGHSKPPCKTCTDFHTEGLCKSFEQPCEDCGALKCPFCSTEKTDCEGFCKTCHSCDSQFCSRHLKKGYAAVGGYVYKRPIPCPACPVDVEHSHPEKDSTPLNSSVTHHEAGLHGICDDSQPCKDKCPKCGDGLCPDDKENPYSHIMACKGCHSDGCRKAGDYNALSPGTVREGEGWEREFDLAFFGPKSGFIIHTTEGKTHDDFHLMCIKDFIRSLLAKSVSRALAEARGRVEDKGV